MCPGQRPVYVYFSLKMGEPMPGEAWGYMTYGNFLLLRPYHGEHGPKVPVTPEYIGLQRVLRERECMSILTKMCIHLISND
jgi:hypothetical protein